MEVEQNSTSLNARSPDDCRWRIALAQAEGTIAKCQFLEQVFGPGQDRACAVNRNVCIACCSSFPPTFEMLNPAIASLVFDRAESLGPTNAKSAEIDRRHSLRRWAEEYLDIEIPALPRNSYVSSQAAWRPSRPLSELLPFPQLRCGEVVCHWAVGVTSAPRRRSRLNECLDSLAQAGWPRPHLFVDGAAEISAKWSDLPRTSRGEQVGAWPNYYLSLLELLMREPLADAFMMVQDDALFYCRENVREYLEQMLWPGPAPGIVSLYCAEPDARPESGWFEYAGRWKFSSIAFIFPREIAQRLVNAAAVFHHRWSAGDDGRSGIPDVVADWAIETSTPFYFPSPSLTQHIGETSAIWRGAYELTPNRRAGAFLGDPANSCEPLRKFPDDSAAEFPEFVFPCTAELESCYRQCVERGRERMRSMSAVICGLCRDAAPKLPVTMARIEKLAAMFGECAIVVFENDSTDATPDLLHQWASDNPSVHVVSERLDQPRLHGTCWQRTDRMAYYRNLCRELVLADFSSRECVVVADLDLNGWSYDGVANTFGHDEWDFVGSNCLSFAALHDQESYEYVDNFAYRSVGQLRASRETHALRLKRGEPLVPVWSCFGGLGVYRRESFQAATYRGSDCEHVTFHESMREQGFDRLFLNPSQIVLYSPWKGDS